MVKYPLLKARNGKKRFLFFLLRLVFFPFDLDWLYEHVNKTAIKYLNMNEGTESISFFGSYKGKDVFENEVFENYMTCDFMENKISIIKGYDKVLKKIYGGYMKLPPKNKQNTRHSITELKI